MKDGDAFTRAGIYLAWAIQGAVVAGVLGATAPQVVATAAIVWGLQNVLRLGNLSARVDVFTQAAQAVAVGQAAPAAVLVSPVLIPPVIEPPALVQPTTIYVPKPKVPMPPYAPPEWGNMPFFEEAAADIISRAPVVIHDPLMRTAAEVGRLYREDHVFALAKSTSEVVTKRVQAIVEEGIVQGLSEEQAIAKILEVNADWTRGYARTVYRTNLATAQTQGRFQQAAKPGMELILPLMVFQSVGDGRVRPNHQACDGAAAAPGDDLWDVISPPLGYG